jgi:hypothetical protein
MMSCYPSGFSLASIRARRDSSNGGQRQFFAERFHRLVGGRAGAADA